MSNFWNKDGLVVDVIKTSNGIKYITPKECSEIDNTYDVNSSYYIGISDLAEGISPRESTTFRLPLSTHILQTM